MQFTSTDLPQYADTVEKVMAWCLMALENRVGEGATGYERVELNNSGVPVAPVFLEIGRVQSGPNFGKAYLRGGFSLFMDEAQLFNIDLFYSVKSLSPTDTIPTKFQDQ